jgi:hypothetical protein
VLLSGIVTGSPKATPPPRKKPPVPPSSTGGSPRDGHLSQGEKDALALKALGLLNEQVQARIVHYRGDLETSPELDAITAQVVQQLKDMQAAMGGGTPVETEASTDIENAHVRTLTKLLKRACAEGELVMQNLPTIGRRVAKLFFESELHEKTKGDKDKVIHHGEQGLYYVLQRYKHRLRTELEGFEYVDADIKEATFDLLQKTERDLQVAFLSRRSPELNRVMTTFTTVLIEFFRDHLPSRLEQMAKVTVKNARTAHQSNSISYKVLPDRFQSFREEWERVLMLQMVNFCGDALMDKLEQSDQAVRDETVKFFIDPHVYSETCEVACDALYDFLCLEGFLDLPVDWRVKIARAAH